jgi:anti-anti-sigma regulatory factor
MGSTLGMAQLGLAPIVSGGTGRLVAMGDLTARTATAVEQAVKKLLDEGVTTLTIDLRQAVAVDNDAVDALVALSARACERGVPVHLCADGATREQFEAAKATALFAAIDQALAAAEALRSLLDVCTEDDVEAPSLDAVTWVSTDEPSMWAP